MSTTHAQVLDKKVFLGVNEDMKRVRILKNYKQYRVGDVVTVSPNEAFGLIDSGVAMISKDMTQTDYRQKVPKPRKQVGKK